MKIIKVILIFILIIANANVKAVDTSNIDSLKKMLDTSSIGNTILIFNKLFELYYNQDTSQALKYIQKSKQKVFRLNNTKERNIAIIKISQSLNKKGLNDLAIQYLYEYLRKKENILSTAEEASIYREIGNQLLYSGEYSKAIDRYFIALNMFSNDSLYKVQIANLYNNIGVSNKSLGQYQIAIEYHIKALKIREQINDTAGLVMSYNNIGHIYYLWGEFNKTAEYFNKAINLSKIQGDEINVAILSNNLGSVYIELNQYSKALNYFEKALIIYQKLGYDLYSSIILANMASIYRDKGNFSKALELYKQSFEIAQRIKNKAQIAYRLSDLAYIYYLKNEYNLALKYAKNCENIESKYKSPEINIDIINIIYKIYKGKGDYKNAIHYLEKLQTYKDSIFDKDKHEQITEIQARYESEQKEKEIELLDKENKIKELQVKRQGLIIFIGLLGLAVLIVLIIFYRRQNNKINIINNRLALEKQRITDSIEYAEKIQSSILPPKKFIDKILNDYFIYYKPCSTISGDFYWIDKKNNKIIVAAADCTGHGVPGGLLSTLGIAILKESINNASELDPKIILDNLNIGLNAALHQTALNKSNPNDGMEIGLLIIDNEKMNIQYSGAKSKLYLIRNRQITEVFGNKRPIGYQKREKAFVNTILKIEPGDNLYLFTDGIVHQIGGENGKLFSISRLKKVLIEISGLSPFAQKFQIEKKIDNWMSKYQQLDDMLLIGIKI